MALATPVRWSPRRMVALWIGGVALQVVLFGGPQWWTIAHVAQWRAQMQAIDQRWDIAELADSLSVTAQRATQTARPNASSAAGSVGIVRVPSSRPSANERRTASHSTLARVVSAFDLYAIPVTLVLITAVWWRRRPAQASRGRPPDRGHAV